MKTPQSDSLSVVPDMPAAVTQSPAAMPTMLQILQAAIRSGEASKNLDVAEKFIALARNEAAFQNKIIFNKAFFALKQEIYNMDFYCDKEAKNDAGRVMYAYCSETEISKKLEPVLFKHGFTMSFGQRAENERVTAIITLVHNEGHEETREYSVRLGSTNRAKDATQADSGSTTSAWRHLVIKWFGLKSRIREDSDAHNEGDFITQAQADRLRARVAALGEPGARFLKFAGAETFEQIRSVRMDSIEAKLREKEAAKPKAAATPNATPQAALGVILDAAGYTFDEFRRWAEAEGQWPDASSAATLYECPAKVAQTMIGAKAGLLAGLARHTGRACK